MKETKIKLIEKSYKFRIYPNQETKDYINYNINGSRFIFNQIKAKYENDRDMIKQLTNSNKVNYFLNRKIANIYLNQIREEQDFLEDMGSTGRQCAYEGLISAFRNISKINNGYVHWKSKKNSVQNYKSKNVNNSIKIVDGKLKLPKIKNTIRMKYSRKIDGKILSATVSNENNKYFVSINVSKSISKQLPKTGKVVGIDLGIKNTIVTSDNFKSGKIIFNKLDEKISRLNQILSCRKLGSKNWHKTKTKLNKAYSKKKNTIHDFLHKTTTKIVNQYDEIFVGDVNSQFTLKNKHLAKSGADAHWFEIKRQLQYKSYWYGRKFKIVNESYTSRTCSSCGYLHKDFNLNIREWNCPACEVSHDRDINAAINIRTVGITGIAFGKTNNIVSGLGIHD